MKINALGEEQGTGGLSSAEEQNRDDRIHLLERVKDQTALIDAFVEDRENNRSTKFSYIMLRENHRICKTLGERIFNYEREMAAQNDK